MRTQHRFSQTEPNKQKGATTSPSVFSFSRFFLSFILGHLIFPCKNPEDREDKNAQNKGILRFHLGCRGFAQSQFDSLYSLAAAPQRQKRKKNSPTPQSKPCLLKSPSRPPNYT